MGLLIPHPRQYIDEENYSGRPTTTWGTTVTCSATPHSLGTRVALIAATAEEYDLIQIEVSETSTSATVEDVLLNIYFGGAGSEVLVIDSLLAGWAQTINSTGPGYTYSFPIRIPRGTRISADARGVVASDTVSVRLHLFRTGNWAGSGVETLGQVTASSRGTQVTPGTTSDGTFTAIGTTVQHWRYIQAMQIGSADTTQNVGVMALDVGTGSALIPGLENWYQTNTSGEIAVPHQGDGRMCDIAAGTALQARLQSSTTDTETKSVCLYGVY